MATKALGTSGCPGLSIQRKEHVVFLVSLFCEQVVPDDGWYGVPMLDKGHRRTLSYQHPRKMMMMQIDSSSIPIVASLPRRSPHSMVHGD